MSLIHAWLQGHRPFADGLQLLRDSGTASSALLSLLDAGETAYARERLVEALTAIAGKVPEPPQPKPRLHPAAAAMVVDTSAPPIDDWTDSQYPVELQEVMRQLRDWYREFDRLRGELRRIPTKDERYTTALRVKELDDLIHAAHYRLDTFRATGTDIGGVVEQPKTRAELLQERNNLRTYISRHNKGTRPATPEQLAMWKQRAAIIQTTLDADITG